MLNLHDRTQGDALHSPPELPPKPPPRRPRPLVAALLGLLAPGLGYLIAGSVKRAIWAALLVPLIPIAMLGVGVHSTPTGAIVIALTLVALIVGPAIHVVRLCRRMPPSPPRSRRRSILRYGLFIAFVFVWDGAISWGRRTVVQHMCVRVMRINGSSMEPTLASGDWVVVDSCRPHGVKPGHLALFGLPTKPSALMIKRVVGTFGDTVQITENAIIVNNRVVSTSPQPVGANQVYGPVTVRLQSYFVMGDNPVASSDSRHFGAVDQSLMHGFALYVLWSARDGFGRALAAWPLDR
jgi:signal peptidase I